MAVVIDGITFDTEWWVEESESDPRARPIRYLQPHHSASTNREVTLSQFRAGGRVVSCNAFLDIDGTLYGIVKPNRRAFTSATSFDHDSFTVEMLNQSGDPTWALTDAQAKRMGKLARELGITTQGQIVQHKDVPGTYATACAGPWYDNQWGRGAAILQYAQGGGSNEEDEMFQKRVLKVSGLPGGARFVVYGPPTHAGDPTLKVLHADKSGQINRMLWDLGKDEGQLPDMSLPFLADHLRAAIGFDIDIQGGAPGAGGSKMVPGFVWGGFAAGGGTVTDLTPVLEAIAAGEAQDAKDLTTLLAAISGVDEATLATFGLKRA